MDRMEILNSELSFQGLTFQYLASCMNSYEIKEMLSAVVMGSVFTESLVKDLCKHFKIEIPENAGQCKLIGKVRDYLHDKKEMQDSDKYPLLVLLERCDEIRLKRNSLVHDKGVPRKEIASAAQDVYGNVMDVVRLYLQTSIAKEICSQRGGAADKKEQKSENMHCSVFISTITPHTVEQQVFINAICNQLSEMGITPVRCDLDDYDKGDPMGKVRDTIKSCDAFFVIGLERSHTFYYRDKESSSSEKEGIHRKHTSGWLHVESGIAMALGKPIFVLCQKDIYGDGIFDRDWNSYIVVEFPMPLDVKHNKVQMTLRKIQEYAETRNQKAPKKTRNPKTKDN